MYEGEVGIFDCGEADHNQIGNMLYDNQELRMALDRPELEMVFIIEKYVINSKISQSPWALETTGLIRYFANRSHIPLHMQTPSQVKNLITNDVVKRAGLYTPGSPHAVDSVRHALFYLITRKGLLTECLRPS